VPGAAVAAVIATVVLPVGSGVGVAAAALVGGVVAFGVVYAISWRGGIDPVRLALVGIAVGIGCNAALSLILIRTDGYISEALAWLVGTLYGSSWGDLPLVLPALATVPIVWLAGRQLDLLAVSDTTPRILGMRLERTRLALLAIAVLLAASAVAVAGEIAFVGLVAPHAARMLAPGSSRAVLPLAATIGVVLVVGADALGRSLIPPFQIPAGIFTALLGAPYFAFLLWRTAR
jgi:iron complex transport system permease protein